MKGANWNYKEDPIEEFEKNVLIYPEKDSMTILPHEKATVSMKLYASKGLSCINRVDWSIFGLKREEFSSISMTPKLSTFSLSLENTSSIPVSMLFITLIKRGLWQWCSIQMLHHYTGTT